MKNVMNLTITSLRSILEEETIDRPKVENLLAFLEGESAPKPLTCISPDCSEPARPNSNYCGDAHNPMTRRKADKKPRVKNDLAGWFDIIMGRK